VDLCVSLSIYEIQTHTYVYIYIYILTAALGATQLASLMGRVSVVYMYIYIYEYAYMYIYPFIYLYKYLHTYIYIHILTYICVGGGHAAGIPNGTRLRGKSYIPICV